jgi:arylsulfatase A-like enzyme
VLRGTAFSRPNILVITSDDMRADDLRWMPNVRHELVARGLVFRNSFAPNPLCAPSRASFLTGRYSHNHRVLDVVRPFGFESFDDSTTLATVLHGAGYRTGFVGKYLNGYGSEPTFGDHHWSRYYVPPGWSQWWGSIDRGSSGKRGLNGGTYDYFHLGSNVNGRLRTWPGHYTTDVTAGQTQLLVRRFGAATPGKPWFLWWTPVAPHHGMPGEPDDPPATRTLNGARIAWPTPARPGWVKHRFDRLITHGAGTPPQRPAELDVSDKPGYISHLPPLTGQEKAAERGLTRQRAEALFVLDRRIGDTLAALRKSGQAARTIVVFTSDNGYYLGEHRIRQGKTTLHEPSIRVPLVMAGPGIPHGVRFDPVGVPDLAVTLADWAGSTLPDADGASLEPMIQQGDLGWTHPVVIEGHMLQPRYLAGTFEPDRMQGLDTLGIRTGQYVYVRYSTGGSELYDLSADPLELTNLQGPASSVLRDELQAVWEQYAACAGAACQVPLPADLQTSPSVTSQITRAQEAARQQYYRY